MTKQLNGEQMFAGVFPISLLNFRSSLASQMVLGVELLVIFSCDSFLSLLVIPFDREDWYDWSPQARPFTSGGVCGSRLVCLETCNFSVFFGIKTMETFLVHLGII